MPPIDHHDKANSRSMRDNLCFIPLRQQLSGLPCIHWDSNFSISLSAFSSCVWGFVKIMSLEQCSLSSSSSWPLPTKSPSPEDFFLYPSRNIICRPSQHVWINIPNLCSYKTKSHNKNLHTVLKLSYLMIDLGMLFVSVHVGLLHSF